MKNDSDTGNTNSQIKNLKTIYERTINALNPSKSLKLRFLKSQWYIY